MKQTNSLKDTTTEYFDMQKSILEELGYHGGGGGGEAVRAIFKLAGHVYYTCVYRVHVRLMKGAWQESHPTPPPPISFLARWWSIRLICLCHAWFRVPGNSCCGICLNQDLLMGGLSYFAISVDLIRKA